MKRNFLVLTLAFQLLGLGYLTAQSLSDSLLLFIPFNMHAGNVSNVSVSTQTTGAFGLGQDRFGYAGRAGQFSGTSSVEVGHTPDIKKPLPLTISAWVYITDTGVYNPVLRTDNHPTLYQGVWLGIAPGGIASVSINNGAGAGTQYRKTLEGSKPVPLNTWTHLAFVMHNAYDMEYYINGERDTMAVYTGIATALVYGTGDGAVGFGYNQFGPVDQYFQGRIDELALWNRALTPAEIKTAMFDLESPMHLPLNGNATDMSAFGNHGTVNGGMPTIDRFGNAASAMQFNGSSDYVEIPADSSFQVNMPFTYSAWVKFDEIKECNIFLSNDADSVYAGAWLNIAPDSTLSMSYGNNIGAGPAYRKTLTSKQKLAPGTWHHIVGVFNTTTMLELYINGIKDTSVVPSGTATFLEYNARPAMLARNTNPFGASSYLKGAIDELHIWARAMSGNEVAIIFTPGVAITQSPTGVSQVAGTTAAFTAEAVGTANDLHFQWQKKVSGNWQNINGQTAKTLSLANITSADGTDYRCIARSLTAYDTSAAATLTVLPSGITEAPVPVANIYPNPAQEMFTVVLNEVQPNTTLALLNINGQKLLQQIISENTTHISLAGLSGGAYLVQLDSPSGSTRKFLIKSN